MPFLHLGKIGLLFVLVLVASAQQPAPKSADTIGPISHILSPAPNFTLPEETYVFGAEWRIWDAGTVTLGLSREGTQQRVTGSAESKGVVSLLYPVHDSFQSLYDPKTFCSIGVRKHTEEGFRKRDTLISFNYTRRKAVLDETNLKNNESKHVENDIPGCVTDVLSGFMYLRSLPLIPGTTYTFPINDGGKTVDVVTRVEAKEQIKVPAGTFQTIRVSPEGGGAFKLKGKIWIWYTDDARRIPVQMRGKMFWGTLTLKLQRIEQPKK
ncbi:MAG TPA: DUF3108 domain-containing protein [Terriglobales bacterium]|nr:DUF3108 domain-containing protein [Terriglobales bacterium]